MGDILGEWLKSTILREISDGLQWLESTSIDSATKKSHFEDDGSILKAKISKPGNVQVTKFVAYKETIIAWVSDSITHIQVQFAISAAHRYGQETRKRITQDSLGAIFQITDFEIWATHLGPRPSRLIILIKDFQNVGSGGSGGVGNPRRLNDLPEVIDLLDRLQMFRSKGFSKARQNLITGEGAEYRDMQPGTQSDSRPASQENFATQVSSLHARNSDSTYHHGNSNDSPTSDHIMKNSLASSIKTLDVLSSTTTAKVITNANAGKSTSHLQTSGFPLKKNPKTVNNQSKTKVRASELLQLLPRELAAEMNKRPKIDTTPVNSRDSRRGSASHTVSQELDDQGGKAQTIPAGNTATSVQRVPSVGTKAVVAPCIEEINREAEVLNDTKPVLELEAVPSPSSLRIRYREVKISKRQQALLDLSNSWIPAKPGQKKPFGNIPVDILQSISDQVEGSLRCSPVRNIQPSSRAESSASTPSSISESQASQISDEIPISPEQWPASPPRGQTYEEIPPDSSEEAPLQVDQPEKEEGEGICPRKHRKLSNSAASFVSANVGSENLTANPKISRKTIGSSTPSSSQSRQDFRTPRVSKPEGKIITRERASPAKYGNSKLDTRSATSSAHNPIDVTLEKTVPTMAALSQETSYPNQHVSGAERNHLTLSPIPNYTEIKDHSSQDNKMSEPLQRSREPSNTIPPIDINVAIDSSEDIKGSHSSGIEIESTQLSEHSKKTLDRDEDPQPSHQSTAPGNDEPVLQVEATPYVNGHLLKSMYIDRIECLSPSRKIDGLPRDRTRFDESDEMRLSSTAIEISSDQISSSKSAEDKSAEFNSSEMARHIPTSAGSEPPDLRVQKVTDCQNSGITCVSRNDTTHVEDTIIFATAPPETSSGDYVTEKSPIKAKDDTQTTKRKFTELQSPSLETAKRQKQVEAFNFKSTEDPEVMVDPSILGDKYRQDFYGSRKSFVDFDANEAPYSSTGISLSSMPDSHTKSISNEDLSGGEVEIDPPLHYTSRKQTPVSDSKDDDMSETFPASGDEQEIENAIFGDRRLAAKTVGSWNATLDMAESQIIDHMQAQDAEQNVFIKSSSSSIKPTIFDQFKAAYRDYAATSEQFVAICRKIERLVKDGHMLHQYLWDDFIIRHKTEYSTYLRSCANTAEDPLPYEQFYHENIVKPLFTNGIVKPENLYQVFVPSQKFMRNSDSLLKTSDSARKPTLPEVTADVTIDLTSDEEVTRFTERQNLTDSSTRKSPRSLPLVTTTNRSRVEVTPTKMKGFSRTSSSNHISPSSLRSAQFSNSKPLKTSFRTSSSPKKVAFGNNDQASDVSTRAKTPMYKSRTEEDLHTLRYKTNTSPILRQSKSMLGPRSADVSEAQKAKEASCNETGSAYDSRLRKRKDVQKTHSSTSHNAQISSKPIFPSRGKSKSKNNTTATTTTTPNNNTNNNPFAKFAKAYAAIRPGNRNSYARDKDREEATTKESGSGGNDGFMPANGDGNGDGEEDSEPQKQKQQIDVMSWRL